MIGDIQNACDMVDSTGVYGEREIAGGAAEVFGFQGLESLTGGEA